MKAENKVNLGTVTTLQGTSTKPKTKTEEKGVFLISQEEIECAAIWCVCVCLCACVYVCVCVFREWKTSL